MLRAETQARVEPLLRAVGEAQSSLLLLDYDGTLAPFRQERTQAFPYPGVAPILQEIARSARTRLVIISGRDAVETVPLLGIEPAPEVWGLHGLQRRHSSGAVETMAVNDDGLDALSDADRWLAYQRLREKAEFKTGSIAMHWRGLSDDAREDLRGRVLLGWRPIAEHAGLDLMEFDGGVEIRIPATDKGEVVRRLLGESEPATPVAYLGDDVTDERAFRALGDRGLSVLVRPRWRQSAAGVWLKPPEELLSFLAQWLEASRQPRTRGGEAAAAVTR